jgi:hypothetical protein
MSDVNYAETYWSEKGKHEELVVALTKLMPVLDPIANPALEKFRVASNCYYDLYNNGLGNKAQEFRRVFGFSGIQLTTTGSRGGELTQRLVDKTEAKMNDIILAAAAEQGVRTDPRKFVSPTQKQDEKLARIGQALVCYSNALEVIEWLQQNRLLIDGQDAHELADGFGIRFSGVNHYIYNLMAALRD